jgi:hypothetical protein
VNGWDDLNGNVVIGKYPSKPLTRTCEGRSLLGAAVRDASASTVCQPGYFIGTRIGRKLETRREKISGSFWASQVGLDRPRR